nr:hypothetical protein CFP56_39006 [Quercus suber]
MLASRRERSKIEKSSKAEAIPLSSAANTITRGQIRIIDALDGHHSQRALCKSSCRIEQWDRHESSTSCITMRIIVIVHQCSVLSTVWIDRSHQELTSICDRNSLKDLAKQAEWLS